MLAGLASVRLAQGGLFLGQAASIATTVISEDPDFQFSHQGTIDTTDMILILAFSKAAAGEFSLALEQANLIQSSSIDLDNPGTWFVSNEQFSSFNAAVLARLYQLSEQYSG